MKRLIAVTVFLSAFFSICQAQPQEAKEILSRMQDHLVTLEYHIVTGGDIPVTYDGTAKLVQDRFRINGNGVEVICDGSAIYLVDAGAKEVCVESPSTIEEYIRTAAASLKEFRLAKVKYSPVPDDFSTFKFDTASLGKDWVITDLR